MTVSATPGSPNPTSSSSPSPSLSSGGSHLRNFFKKKKAEKPYIAPSNTDSGDSNSSMMSTSKISKANSSSLTNSTNLPNDERCTFRVGVADDANKKFRRTMEDSHTYIYNFANHPDWGYFGLFDGHAGHATAEWCSKNLHMLAANYVSKHDRERTPGTDDRASDIPHALYNTFTDADDQIGKLNLRNSGSTAAVAVLRWEDKESSSSSSQATDVAADRQRMLYVANVGDTRVVLNHGGKALRLTYDHKGSDPYETKRIVNLGGIVVGNRVNGVLAVTRSLGDSSMKEFVSGAPYTTATKLSPTDGFIIIACDGLWDVCDDQTACDLIQGINNPTEASKKLITYALDHGSSDNLTCMVVIFDWEEVSAETGSKGESIAEKSSASVASSSGISTSSPSSTPDQPV